MGRKLWWLESIGYIRQSLRHLLWCPLQHSMISMVSTLSAAIFWCYVPIFSSMFLLFGEIESILDLGPVVDQCSQY